MELDGDICYRAVESRDGRFDGKFFTAVLTTGVYCRPICPARTPKRAHMRFYPSAAAAQAAGFRPCLRCRPEASPGTPAWNGTEATVSRALRLIEEGALDEGNLDGLSGRLGVGTRHLRRLFVKHLGAPPLPVAQTRRLHLAKKLLDETGLPITEIAFISGFSSVRRFNESFRGAYKRAPSQFRRRSQGLDINETEMFQLKLAYRPPFDWPELLEFLDKRAIPGVEEVAGGHYRRSVRLGDAAGVFEVTRGAGDFLVLRAPIQFLRHIPLLVAGVRRIFDLGADPVSIAAHLKQDSLLAPCVLRRPGLRVPGTWNPFELAVRAVLGQQVSVQAATTLAGRLAVRYGTPLCTGARNGVTHLFPTPVRLAGARLEGIGMPKARSTSITGLARAVADGALELSADKGLEAFVKSLRVLRGFGPWTAQYVAMRALGEPDAFPAGDLGLQKAAAKNGNPMSGKALEMMAEAWRPWRSYAAVHLWMSLGDSTGG